jgi:hypothetical protein
VPTGCPTAAVFGTASVVYQFSLTYGATTVIVRDYSTSSVFLWMPLQEGAYSVTVSAKSGFGAGPRTLHTAIRAQAHRKVNPSSIAFNWIPGL